MPAWVAAVWQTKQRQVFSQVMVLAAFWSDQASSKAMPDKERDGRETSQRAREGQCRRVVRPGRHDTHLVDLIPDLLPNTRERPQSISNDAPALATLGRKLLEGRDIGLFDGDPLLEDIRKSVVGLLGGGEPRLEGREGRPGG